MTTVEGMDFLASVLGDETETTFPAASTPEVSFTIKKFLLQLMLDKAATVLPAREVMPVLRNFQFQVRPNLLRVVASNMEQSMIVSTELVTVTAPGVVVLPARKMLDMVRQAQDDLVKVRVRDLTAFITIGRTRWSFKLALGADYPAMPTITDLQFSAVDRLAFLDAMLAVRYAVSKDAGRDNLRMIDVRAGKMTACDGSRFQQATFTELPFNLRIPLDAVDDLIKLLKSADLTTVEIGESDNHLIFRVGADVCIVNKLMAQFLDMEQALLRPALTNKHDLTVSRAELIAAIKRVRINADPETSALALTLDHGQLTVMARDKYGNDSAETIDATWAAAERTLVVNHSFLLDMLNGYDADICHFRIGDDMKSRKAPVLLKDPDTGTVGVVQQMLSDWVGLTA